MIRNQVSIKLGADKTLGQLPVWLRLLVIVCFWAVAGLILSDLGRDFVLGVELTTVTAVDGFPGLLSNLAYWPYFVAVWLVDLVINNPLVSARLVTGLLAWLAVAGFWLLICRLFNSYLALVALVLLTTNSWFLQLAQTADPAMFSLSLVLVFGAWLALTWADFGAWPTRIGLLLFLFLSLFCPVLIWLSVGVGLVFIWRFRHQLWAYYLLIWLLIAVGWLLFLAAESAVLTATLIGFNGPDLAYLTSLQDSILALAFGAPATEANPAGLALLDYFSGSLLLFGLWSLKRQLKPGRLVLVLVWPVGLFLLLAGSGGPNYAGFSLVIVPALVLLVFGLVEFYRVFHRVFPSNPLAACFGLIVIGSLVSLMVGYQLSRHFLVWPKATTGVSLVHQSDSVDCLTQNNC